MCCTQGEDSCGRCVPYKDPVFMTAQALSVLAIFFSWGFVLTGLLGFVSFIMLQVAWCCKMNRCGLITAGVFACFDALGCAIVGIYILAAYTDEDEGYYYDESSDTSFYFDEEAANTWGAICLIGALLWTAVAVCIFVFTCGRMQRLEREQQEKNNNEATDSKTATEVPVAAATITTAPPTPEKMVAGDRCVDGPTQTA